MEKLDNVLERHEGSENGTEDQEDTQDGAGESLEELPDNRLFGIYERYIGEPEDETDVYLGFTFFVGGIGFGVIAFLFILLSSVFEPGTSGFWTGRRLAITLGTLGLPSFLLGVVVLLPVKKRAAYAAGVGGFICLLAVAFFNTVYPHSFNVPGEADYTLEVIAFYSVGLATVIASMSSALIAYYLEKVKPAQEVMREIEEEEDEEDISDEKIRSDIDEAMANSDISWGGVEKKDMKKLEFSTPESEMKVQNAGTNVKPKTKRTKGNVDDAVAGLKSMRGGQKNEAKSETTVDDQTQALKELKKRKQERGEDSKIQTGAETESQGFLDRIKNALGLQ